MSLVEFWRGFQTAEPPFVHPADLEAVGRRSPALLEPVTFESFVGEGFSPDDRQRMHLSLLPAPYLGDLATADVFILLMNPGFAAGDYYAEEQPVWRDRAIANLAQRLRDDPFPQFALDPRFAWSGAFIWWESKLRDLARELVDRKRVGNYREALSLLSRRIATIELVPYHSQGGFPSYVSKLESVTAAMRFVQEELVPRAAQREITVIATRQVAAWG